MAAEANIEISPESDDISSAKEMIKFFQDLDGSHNLKSAMISILQKLSEGQTISVIASDSEITTTEAAKILHVSKGYLLKIVDEGKIPCRKIGAHRRIKLKDLILYKDLLEKQRNDALKNLTALSQDIEG